MQEYIDKFSGENLKKLREAKLLTQQQLGKEIGVSNITIWQWEQGTVKPRITHLKTLKEFFEKE
jgi:transcriptional regulator with XRE-family HTH domain